MSEQVTVDKLSDGAYAAAVRDGERTTHHHVTLPPGLLEELLLPEVEPSRVVEESVRYLLEREPGVAIPHDIDLTALRRADSGYLTELQTRLAG